MALILETEFLSKTGARLTFRSLVPSDAQALHDFLKQAYSETEFILPEPGESFKAIDLARVITAAQAAAKWVYMAVFESGRVVGVFTAIVSLPHHPGRQHVANLHGVLLKEFWGSGVARAVVLRSMGYLERKGVTRFEATVQSRNLRIQTHLQSLGFVIEGHRSRSLRVGENLLDETLLSRLSSDPSKLGEVSTT